MYIKGAGAAALAMAAFAAIPAGAAITIQTGSFGAGTGVHSTGAQSADTVNGVVNQDGSAVTFSSTSTLSIPGAGEATITGTMSTLDVLFAKGWTNITFAFQNLKGTKTCSATITESGRRQL